MRFTAGVGRILPAIVFLAVACGEAASPPSENVAGGSELIRDFPIDTGVARFRELRMVMGQVIALVTPEPFVRRYLDNGVLVEAILRRGGGPEEMLVPLHMADVPGSSELVLWEPGTRKTLILDMNEGLRGTVPMTVPGGSVNLKYETLYYGRPGGFEFLADSTTVFLASRRAVVSVGDVLPAELIIRMRGGAEDTLQRFGGSIVLGGSPQPKTFFGDVPLWARCHPELIAFLSGTGDSVVWVDHRGRRRAAVGWTPTRRPIVDEDRLRFLQLRAEGEARGSSGLLRDFSSRVQALLPQVREYFAEESPRAVEMLCDRLGRAWFQGFDTQDNGIGRGAHWVRIDSSGTEAAVELPRGFQLIGVYSDTLLGIRELQDGTTIISLRRLIERP